MGRSTTPAWGELFVYLLLYAWVLRKKSAEAEESYVFFEYYFVFTFICMGFKEEILQKLRKAVGFLNILLHSLLFAWILWKLLDANDFAAIRMGFERILEMLSL